MDGNSTIISYHIISYMILSSCDQIYEYLYTYIYMFNRFVSYKAQGLQNSHPLYTEPVRRCAYWLSPLLLSRARPNKTKRKHMKKQVHAWVNSTQWNRVSEATSHKLIRLNPRTRLQNTCMISGRIIWHLALCCKYISILM